LLTSLCILFNVSSAIAVYDDNLTNNEYTTSIDVQENRNIKVVFRPIDALEDDYQEYVEDSAEFMQEVYPVKEFGIQSTIRDDIHDTENAQYLTDDAACQFLTDFRIASRITVKADHRLVGFVSASWFGEHRNKPSVRGYTCDGNLNTAIVNLDSRHNVAHEIGHTYFLCDEYAESDWIRENRDYPGGCNNANDGGSFDEDCLGSSSEPNGCSVTVDKAVVHYKAGSGDITGYNFMGDWLNPDKRWISIDAYTHLLGMLSTEYTNEIDAKQAMLISGTVLKNGTIELNPVYWLENNTINNYSSSGNISLEVITNQSVSHKINFTPDFNIYETGGNTSELNFSTFVYVVPAYENTTSIIFKQNGTKIVEINVSPHAPSVTVDNIEVQSNHLAPFNLTWSGSDADNDDLQYAVLYSNNGGLNYSTIVVNYNQTIITINPNQYKYSDQYVFKVIVSDGFSSSFNISNTMAMGKDTNSINMFKSNGSEVMYFSENGSLYITGIVHENIQQNTPSSDNELIIQSNSEYIFVLNISDGDIYLKGTVLENQSISSASATALVFRDEENNVNGYVNTTGHMFLKGEVFENANP